MISCVSATDSRGVLPCLASHSQIVGAHAHRGGGGQAGHGGEVQPELTDIIRYLPYCEYTAASGGWCVGAWIVRVTQVGGVGGDCGAAGGGGDDAANSKASSAVTICRPSFAGALRRGVAGPVGGAGARGGTNLIGELNY